MHHLRAAALLGIVGDYPSLQGTLFNLANCRRETLQKQGLPLDDAIFDIVELSRRISKRCNIGGESAQIEIAAAQWAYEKGDITRARYYLGEAEALIKHVDMEAIDTVCQLFGDDLPHRSEVSRVEAKPTDRLAVRSAHLPLRMRIQVVSALLYDAIRDERQMVLLCFPHGVA